MPERDMIYGSYYQLLPNGSLYNPYFVNQNQMTAMPNNMMQNNNPFMQINNRLNSLENRVRSLEQKLNSQNEIDYQDSNSMYML